MRWLTALFVLLFVVIASALDPPTLMWEREYFTDRGATFFHVIQTSDGGFGISAAVAGSTSGNRPIIKMDSDGNIEWFAGNIYNYQNTRWVVELADSSLVGTGEVIPQSGDPVGLFLLKVDSAGNILWTKIYNFTTGYDVGHCVTQLPDGGFAVCGEYDEWDSIVMRTDANGDTLWTRVFNTGVAFRIIHHDDGLTVFCDSYSGGPYMLRYSMDGVLLWNRIYTGLLPPGQAWGGDMCLASDFGYMIASSFWAHIAQTDWLGYLIWNKQIPGSLRRCGLSLNPTKDGGYIFSGWEGYAGITRLQEYSPPADTGTSYDGWLVKLDSLGNAEWHIQNELGLPQSNFFNCARQLQGGGYIVAGKIGAPAGSGGPNGYLLRYAPETGIEEGEAATVTGLNISPNPFSSSLSISYDLPEPIQVELSVYDLSGRLLKHLDNSLMERGLHQVVWNPSFLQSGCYLIRLRAGNEILTENCVYLR